MKIKFFLFLTIPLISNVHPMQHKNSQNMNDSATERCLAEHAKGHQTYKADMTRLHRAAIMGHHHCVALAIKKNDPIDELDTLGSTALHYAAQEGKDLCVKALIDAHANVHIPDQHGDTALDNAAQFCVAKMPFGNPTNSLSLASTRINTLIFAIHFVNYKNCIKQLLKAGALLRPKNLNLVKNLVYNCYKELHEEVVTLRKTSKN